MTTPDATPEPHAEVIALRPAVERIETLAKA
jgi:hypothetical protein